MTYNFSLILRLKTRFDSAWVNKRKYRFGEGRPPKYKFFPP